MARPSATTGIAIEQVVVGGQDDVLNMANGMRTARARTKIFPVDIRARPTSAFPAGALGVAALV
jgi:hypothetical protein